MTDQELSPFLGKPVSVTLTTGQTITGILARPDAATSYSVESIDDELPSVTLRSEEIQSVQD